MTRLATFLFLPIMMVAALARRLESVPADLIAMTSYVFFTVTACWYLSEPWRNRARDRDRHPNGPRP